MPLSGPGILSRSDGVFGITRNRSGTRANALSDWRLAPIERRRKRPQRAAQNRSDGISSGSVFGSRTR